MPKQTQTLKIEHVPYTLMTALRLTATRGGQTLREYVITVLTDNSEGPRKLVRGKR